MRKRSSLNMRHLWRQVGHDIGLWDTGSSRNNGGIPQIMAIYIGKGTSKRRFYIVWFEGSLILDQPMQEGKVGFVRKWGSVPMSLDWLNIYRKLLLCGKHKNKPTIWGWFIPCIYGDFGDLWHWVYHFHWWEKMGENTMASCRFLRVSRRESFGQPSWEQCFSLWVLGAVVTGGTVEIFDLKKRLFSKMARTNNQQKGWKPLVIRLIRVSLFSEGHPMIFKGNYQLYKWWLKICPQFLRRYWRMAQHDLPK